MNKLEKITNEMNELEKINQLKNKINKIKDIKNEINNEIKIIEKTIDKLNNSKSKKIKEYKNLNIDKLQEKFENEKNLDKKIELYSHICYKIDKISQEIFGDNKDSDSEEIEFDSENSSENSSDNSD